MPESVEIIAFYINIRINIIYMPYYLFYRGSDAMMMMMMMREGCNEIMRA